MISLITESGGREKEAKFMTLSQMRVVAKAWKPPHPKDGASIIEDLRAVDEETEIIHYPGLEPAIIGLVSRCGEEEVLCYSRDRIVAILMLRDGMTHEDAEEFIDHNIAGGAPGPRAPMLLS